jgi:hypothetical protein
MESGVGLEYNFLKKVYCYAVLSSFFNGLAHKNHPPVSLLFLLERVTRFIPFCGTGTGLFWKGWKFMFWS